MADNEDSQVPNKPGFGPGLESETPPKKEPIPQRAYHAGGYPPRNYRQNRYRPTNAQTPSSPVVFTSADTRGKSQQRPQLGDRYRGPQRGQITTTITAPYSSASAAKDDADTPTSDNATTSRSAMKRMGRRMGMPRKKLNRPLQPTKLHEGKIGTPKGLEGTDTLKVFALGGLGEVGRNCYCLEYKDDIIVIDAGMMFPNEDMPGIDFVIPNTTYLEGKREHIRGMLLTHGHMDHIGGIPYVQTKLGNPDIYTAELTKNIVLKRHSEFPQLPKLPIHVVKDGDRVKLGDYFTVEFFHMNHNIPDDLGIFVETPVGNFMHTADFKFDPTPINDTPVDMMKLREFGDRGVLLLMIDCMSVEQSGHSISEQTIFENMEPIFKDASGMLLFGMFSSMINRMQQIVQLSEKYGRKVIFDGYSIKTNVEIAKEMGYLKLQKGTQISMEQFKDYPRDKVTIQATGALGQESASMMRIVNGEHRHIQLQNKDTIVFSSSIVPGNERSVQYLKDMFYRAGVKVYHYQMLDIHAGGHARREELREMMLLTRPKFVMPHHGYYSMMVTLGELGTSIGIPRENVIIADNGLLVNVTADQWWFDTKTAPVNSVMVDGLGVGDIGTVVLRDRQALAEDGMFTIICIVEPKTGRMRTSPDIISRGFIYLKEQKDLLMQVRKRVRTIVEGEKARPLNLAYLKDEIRDQISMFLFQKTERRPMVLPVIIEV